LEPIFSSVLGLLKRYGLGCTVSREELLVYLQAPSYEDNSVDTDTVLSNELLLLHEVAEICLLKKMGHEITQSTIMEVYPDTYRAHLEALRIELNEAMRRGRHDWIRERCRDLESYLGDPNLPAGLERTVHELINEFCTGSRHTDAKRFWLGNH